MTDATDQPDADETSAGTDRFAAQLKQDVRSWTARDNSTADRNADAALELGAKQAKAAAAASRKRAKAAAVPAPAPAAPTGTKSRPFSMSYEGVSNEQYLAGRIARGAR